MPLSRRYSSTFENIVFMQISGISIVEILTFVNNIIDTMAFMNNIFKILDLRNNISRF